MGLLRGPSAYLGCLNQQLGLGSTDVNINGAAVRFGLRFTVNESKTLSSLRIYTDSISGSPTGGCEIFAMGADGNPTGAALADSTTHAPNPFVAGSSSFSGYSLALTAGAWYVAVFRNTHGTPASNSYRVPVPQNGGIPMFGLGYGAAFGWSSIFSTDSGSSWNGLATGSTCLTLVFNDSSTIGWPYRGQWNTGTADGVYGTRELGNRIVMPAGSPLQAIGIAFHTRGHTGTPTGFLVGKIRLASDNSLLDTTHSLSPIVTMGGNLRCALHFASPVQLEPETAYDFLLAETTQSDTSGNRYNFEGTTIEASRPEVPGGIKKIYFNGSTWDETTTQLVHMGVILDEEISVAGAGGSGFAGSSLLNRGLN